MGAVFAKLIDAIVWVVKSIIVPLIRLTAYLLFISLAVALVANLAGILGTILFFIVFFYYVRGILFVNPAPSMQIVSNIAATTTPGIPGIPGAR